MIRRLECMLITITLSSFSYFYLRCLTHPLCFFAVSIDEDLLTIFVSAFRWFLRCRDASAGA